MPFLGKEDTDEIFSHEQIKESIQAVKRSNAHISLNEKRAFKFGVVSATSLLDDFVDEYGAYYDEYSYDDDDIHMIAQNIDKKLMEAV